MNETAVIKADKYLIDKTLLSINATLLFTFAFVFNNQIESSALKWAIITALTLAILSMILLVWYVLRHPKRQQIFQNLSKRTREKF